MSSPDQKLATSSGPLVSVAITAFNSERWLPRAVDSAINQRTDFPIEIIVADDCSTDATLRLAHSYRERYPNLVRVLERTKNIGMQRNYYETFEHCQGKYIAWLDADDFWTDPEKLAIQVKTLESDPTLNVCGHFVRWVSTDGEVKRERYPSIAPGRYGLAEILHHNFLPSLSVMFRNGIHRDLPAWYFDLAPTTDWPIFVLAALSGDIVLLDRVMADYMLAPGSSLMSKGSLFWHTTDARFYEKIESILPSRWQRLARAEKGKRYEWMAYALRKQGNFVASREAAFKAFCLPSRADDSGTKTRSLLAAVIRETRWRLRGKPTAEANEPSHRSPTEKSA